MHNCTIGGRGDEGKGSSQVILIHSQDGGGGVLATYVFPVGVGEVHPSPCLWRESNFTQRNLVWGGTPPHRFFQISQSLFSSPEKEI